MGSELRRPLGIAIVGGLIFSQMMTLYTTPVIYLYLDRFRLWFNRLRGKAQNMVSQTKFPLRSVWGGLRWNRRPGVQEPRGADLHKVSCYLRFV